MLVLVQLQGLPHRCLLRWRRHCAHDGRHRHLHVPERRLHYRHRHHHRHYCVRDAHYRHRLPCVRLAGLLQVRLRLVWLQGLLPVVLWFVLLPEGFAVWYLAVVVRWGRQGLLLRYQAGPALWAYHRRYHRGRAPVVVRARGQYHLAHRYRRHRFAPAVSYRRR